MLRAASHEAFGRVVFDWPSHVAYTAEIIGDRLILRFGDRPAPNVGALRPPRNVTALTTGDGQVEVALRPGARVRHFRMGTRVVVDVHDATGVEPAMAAAPAPEPRRAERPSAPRAAARNARPAPTARTATTATQRPAPAGETPVQTAAPGPAAQPSAPVAAADENIPVAMPEAAAATSVPEATPTVLATSPVEAAVGNIPAMATEVAATEQPGNVATPGEDVGVPPMVASAAPAAPVDHEPIAALSDATPAPTAAVLALVEPAEPIPERDPVMLADILDADPGNAVSRLVFAAEGPPDPAVIPAIAESAVEPSAATTSVATAVLEAEAAAVTEASAMTVAVAPEAETAAAEPAVTEAFAVAIASAAPNAMSGAIEGVVDLPVVEAAAALRLIMIEPREAAEPTAILVADPIAGGPSASAAATLFDPAASPAAEGVVATATAAAMAPEESSAALSGAVEEVPPVAGTEPQHRPIVVVGAVSDEPELALSEAITAAAPQPTPPVTTPEPPAVVAARLQLERALAAAAASVDMNSAETTPVSPVAVASIAPAAPEPMRPEGGAKAAEVVAPVVTPPATPAVAAATPVPAPTGQVVLIQQQRGAPALPPLSAPAPFPSSPGSPGATRIQVLPGQPIPPLLGGSPAPAAAPLMPGMTATPDQRPPMAPVPIMLDAGAGRLLQLPAPAAAVFAADPRVARVQPASPTSLFMMAVGPGRTNVIATGDDGTPIIEYDVTVSGRAAGAAPAAAPSFAAAAPAAAAGLPRASVVESMIRRTIRGGEGVRVAALAQRGYILSGLVPTAADAQRAEAIAKAMGGENSDVINNLSLLSSIQVNVRVRVAEISRQVTRELGFNWQALGRSGDWLFGLTSGGAGLLSRVLPSVPGGSADTGGRYGFRWSNGGSDVNSIIDALAQDNLVSVLAEPNLTAQSGEVASFLAGGEFPVPVAGSTTGGAATVTIEFKSFGVGLAFVPTVLSPERLNLRVRPEVSELSENGAITVPLANGTVRIPALTVRRAETTVELGSGQSFAIAGLLSRSYTMTQSSLIGLGDIPVLGALFRSDRFRRQETELVIIVTPYLVRPVSDPRALVTAPDRFRPATDLDRVLWRRQSARGGSAPAPEGRRPPVDAGFIVE